MLKRFFVQLIHSVPKHNIGSLGAVLAYFGFSSMLPVLALLIVTASHLLPANTIEQFLQDVLRSYLPAIPMEGTFTGSTIRRLATFGSEVSIIGVIGLLWGTIGGFVNLQQTLDTILEVRKRRSFVKQYLVGFVMLGVLLALTVASSIVSVLSPVWMTTVAQAHGMGNPHAIRWIRTLGQFTFPFVLFVTCYLIYRILPSHRLRTLPLVVGAAFATLGIYISRALYGVYTHHLGNYEVMYGTLTFVMLFTFWIYIVCMLLLFGAEVAVAMEKSEMVKSDGKERVS